MCRTPLNLLNCAFSYKGPFDSTKRVELPICSRDNGDGAPTDVMESWKQTINNIPYFFDNFPEDTPGIGTGITASMIQPFVLPESFDLLEASTTLVATQIGELVR